MDSSSSEMALIERLADEFADRQRRGEQPSLEEYVERHPDLASEIREVFPALVMIDHIAPAASDLKRSQHGFSAPLEQLGDYRILREIGRGGMGVVYEAEQASLGRRVALKVLPREMVSSPRSMQRFQREARAAARMHHTNIVPVFEVGQQDETAFYAMQLIQGQGIDLVIDDLKRLRKAHLSRSGKSSALSVSRMDHSIAASLVRGRFHQEDLAADAEAVPAGQVSQAVAQAEPDLPFTETGDHRVGSTTPAALPGQSEISTAETNRNRFHRSVAQIGVQTADALAYAHARGIIHRDIKPSNLILDAGGVVWVTDFGLAKTDDEAMTHTGDILGTLRYMSPERFRGRCDVRADIYSLGLTLYEMLALKPAFESPDRLKLIEMIRESEAPRPRRIDPRIPRDLETIVLKSIDRDPRRRYQSADELSEDLQRFVDDESIKARRVSSPERFVRWCRHNKGLAASLLTVAALVSAIAVGSTFTASYFRNLAQENARQRKRSDTALYHSLVSEAAALRAAREPGYKLKTWSRLTDALAINTSAKDVNRLRQEAAACFGDFIALEPRVWEYPDGSTGAFSLFPDGRQFALGLDDLSVTIVATESGQQTARLRTEIPTRIFAISISPDGEHLLVCGTRGAVEHWVCTAGTWRRKDRFSTQSPRLAPSALFFPDGRRYAVAEEKSVIVRGVFDRELDQSLGFPEAATVGTPAISHDGELLAMPLSFAGSYEIWIWNVGAGEFQHRLQSPLSAYEVAFTPDDRYLLSAGDDGFVTFETESFRQWSIARLDTAYSLTFTPDGRMLAYATLSGKIRLWDLAAHRQVAMIDDSEKIYSRGRVVISPDGNQLFCADKAKVRAFRIRGLSEKLSLAGHTEMVPCAAFSPDGRTLATGGKDRLVKLWETDTGALIESIPQPEDVQTVEFCPQGQLLAIGSTDGHLMIRDLESGAELTARKLRKLRYVAHVAFTSDSRTLVACGFGGMSVFDIVRPGDAGEVKLVLEERDHVPSPRCLYLAISADDRYVAWVHRGFRLRVWDLQRRRDLQRFPDRRLLLQGWHNVSFLADSRHVIFVGGNGKPQVWNAETGELAYEIANAPRFLSFHNAASPDGCWLAADATAEALTIVDIYRKQHLLTLGGERSPLKSIAWSPGSRRVALGLADGGVVIWNLDSVQMQLNQIGLGWK